MDERVIFLRKKIKGENSIENFAFRVAEAVGGVVKVCPCHSTSIRGMIENIKFAKKEQGKINHIVMASESYLLPFLNGKKISTIHDIGTILTARNKLYSFMRKMMFIKTAEFFADVITFVSNTAKQEFEKQQWKKKIKEVVIFNSCDEKLIPCDTEQKESTPCVLHIGTGKRKNLENVIQAMKGLEGKLLIVGILSSVQRKLLVECNVDFENYFDIPFEKIVELYNRCAVVSFPTFYEGFGMPAVEANVMQKPLLTSDLPVIKEVTNGAAYYVNPNDIEEIHRGFDILLKDKDKRQKLIQKGKENAKRFSKEIIYEQYKNLYQEMQK